MNQLKNTYVLLIAEETPYASLALVVTMEDEQLHTDAHPFCTDSTCPCHEDELDNGLSYVPAYHYTSQHNADWLNPKDK